MSSFKKLSKSDVTVVPYYANKQWTSSYCPYPTSSEYLIIYKGSNLTSSFNLDYDPITEDQYERLIYSQINQLFYQEYTASLNTSSLANSLYYESASQQRPTSSYFIYNDSSNFINNFPTGTDISYAINNFSGSIRVLNINQEIYSNKVLPNSFRLSSSAYNIIDDGYGNLYDNTTHVGNLFYAHGLAIITNQDYQLMFPLPPLAITDKVSFYHHTTPKTISASFNDVARSGTLITSSILISDSLSGIFTSGSVTGSGYSWSTGSLGTVVLTTTKPGKHTLYYTIGAYVTGSCPITLRSNKGKIVVDVQNDCDFTFLASITGP
jgi:hypothetical protein